MRVSWLVAAPALAVAQAEIDLRVCTLFGLRQEPWALIVNSVKHWEALGLGREKLNYILSTDGAEEKVGEAMGKLLKMGIYPENIYREGARFTVARQGTWFSRCSVTCVMRRPPSEGAKVWYSWLDADELPVFPSGVSVLASLGDLEERRIDVMAGIMVDRVAESGALLKIHDDTNLFEQFPVRCSITNTVVDMNEGEPTKGFAFSERCVRATDNSTCHFRFHDGAHHLSHFGNEACNQRQHFMEIAHFKWTDDVLPKLCWRTRSFAFELDPNIDLPPPGVDEKVFWNRESINMLNYLRDNNDTINTNSDLCFKEIAPDRIRRGSDGALFRASRPYVYVGLPPWEEDWVTCDSKIDDGLPIEDPATWPKRAKYQPTQKTQTQMLAVYKHICLDSGILAREYQTKRVPTSNDKRRRH